MVGAAVRASQRLTSPAVKANLYLTHKANYYPLYTQVLPDPFRRTPMIRVLELESSRGWGGQERRTVRLTSNLNPDEFKFFFAAPEDSELYRRRKEIPGRFFPIPLRQSYDL